MTAVLEDFCWFMIYNGYKFRKKWSTVCVGVDRLYCLYGHGKEVQWLCGCGQKRSTGYVGVAKKGLQVVWMWTAALLSLVAFFLVCEDFGRMFDSSFPACAFFFFFKVEISSCTL